MYEIILTYFYFVMVKIENLKWMHDQYNHKIYERDLKYNILILFFHKT